MTDRMDKDERKELILAAAYNIAVVNRSYRLIRRDDVAIEANVSKGLVTHYFGDITQLQEAVVSKGLKCGDKRIILQAILNGHKSVSKMTKQAKIKVMRDVC